MQVFKGYSTGREGIPISLLQYADDTIFVGEASWKNVWAIKSVLQLFELVAGLKVNFHKSKLLGANIDSEILGRMATFLNCKVGHFSCSYLGLFIGANPNRLSTWQTVISKVEKKLTKWKGKLLSFGGRLVLLKSVLNSIPNYFLSFFKAPTCVISHLESLLKNFLWGGDDEHKKIAWVSWDDVCKEKHYGGLGVRDLRSFNLALLGKWRWRLLVERDCLWVKVITSIYGAVTSLNRREGATITCNWFSKECVRVVGNGRNTSFWRDPWCTTKPFCERYSRLFSISNNKDMSVADMKLCREAESGWNWCWRRQLFQWEQSQLSLLMMDLTGVQIDDTNDDSWKWLADPSGLYSVKSGYYIIVNASISTEISLHKFIWCRLVPSKVSCFAWRVMLDRIPIKVNLAKTNLLLSSNSGCVWCNQGLDTSCHIFFECSFAYQVWMLCLEWCGLFAAHQNNFISHFEQFLGLPSCGAKNQYK
uniref:Ribonuclease H protein At1g65750 family n=1 Tax=Cajanus cajan TaxID=3821 RepID=A0A151RKL7_CAJCA|nr:Putative ribonuclease H protein At1g65750 family [Cajanus cajan]